MSADDGRTAGSPLAVPLSGWRQVLMRTWSSASADNLGLLAAGVAFYAFLAFVPLLAATVLVYGLVADIGTLSAHARQIAGVLPGDVARLVIDQLVSVVTASQGKKGWGLVLAIGIALFGARNAAGSIVAALNVAYGERETRGFMHTNLLALGITLAGVVGAAAGSAGAAAIRLAPVVLPSLPDAGLFLARGATYLGLGGAACVAAAVLYRFGPSRDDPRWRWLSAGAVAFAVSWVVLTILFGIYVANFGNYGATYGALSAVVVMLTWIWLSGYALLFGAKLNAELERQTVRDTTRGPDRPLGARGAWAADTVAPAQR